MNNKVVVVGAGASGCMAAITAAQNGGDVVLLDKNDKIGRKLLITGKGRCNVTNNCDMDTLVSSVTSNGKFLYSAFAAFTPQDVMSFFEDNGVPLKTERGFRVFPQSDKAVDIVDALYRLIVKLRIRLVRDNVTELILDGGKVIGVRGSRREYLADSVIVCCGGCSYPATGSSGGGYALARQAGHTIIAPVPSLVPVEVRESWCKQLQGLSLRNVSLTVRNGGKTVYSDFGEMLFTHFGVSGPMVLSASARMCRLKGTDIKLVIDLKPALTNEQLDKRIQRDFEKYINRDIINALGDLLPQKLIPVVIQLADIDPHAKCRDITRTQRFDLLSVLKELTLTFKSFRPIEEAIVTAGGVSVKEINPKTMESKLVKGLYFAGEVIDVDAYTGGFNLQIAFSTGHLAGSN